MLSVSRQLFPQAPLANADVGDLPVNDRTFDIVLLRHVLEHLPRWLMLRAIASALRVARRAVIVDFHVPSRGNEPPQMPGIGSHFVKNHWSERDLIGSVTENGWKVFQRFAIAGQGIVQDQLWIVAPPALADEWEHPKVSIIMPTFRRAHRIYRTIERISTQTYTNWELIVIDNAGDLPDEFRDPRIRFYRDAAITSASYARNQGLRHALGELVCFFDDDDDMFPHYLERFVHTFREHPETNMVRCGMNVSNGQVNYSYATPECWLRRPFAKPLWTNRGPSQDQQYFKKIIGANGWSEEKGDIVTIHEALCRANADQMGGLRSGRY